MTANRNNELARIHILKAQLNLPDRDYREMLWTQARVHSAKDLDSFGRQRVLMHLSKMTAAPGTFRHIGTPPHNLKSSPQLQKIQALLADAKRPWDYVQSMAQGMYRKDDITFCSPAELSGIIAALVKDKQRRIKRAEV